MIKNGQKANQDNLNAAFQSRTVDTSTTGKVSLINTADVASGPQVTNTQRAINETFDAVGMTGEGDATRKQYSSSNYVAPGDSHKVAIGKLDAQAKAQTTANVPATQVTGSLPFAQVSGTVPITQGGTGQTTQGTAFNALSPLTTKADLIVRDASTNNRLPVGSDAQVLTADSTLPLGMKWATVSAANPNVGNATGTLPIANGGTGQSTKTLAFDALAPTTTLGDFAFRGATNNVRLGIGATNQVLTVSNSGLPQWATPTSSGSGFNYLTDGDFETSIAQVSLATVTLTNGLPSGAPAAGASSITLAAETAAPLRKSQSLRVSAASAWAAGQGIQIGPALVMQPQDLGRIINVNINYQIASGAGSLQYGGKIGTQGLMIAVYDVTAATWLPLLPGALDFSQSSGSRLVTATFQSSVINGQQYQLYVLNGVASTGAVSVLFDEVSFGPNPLAGSPDSRNILFKGAVTATQTLTANTTPINLSALKDSAAGWSSNTYTSGLSGDYVVSGTIVVSGTATISAYVNGVFNTSIGVNTPSSQSRIALSGLLINVPTNAAITFRSDANINVVFATTNADTISLIRVGGQSGNTPDARVLVGKFGGTSGNVNTTSGAGTPYIFPAAMTDTFAGYSTATGRYTVNTSGFIEVTFSGSSVGGAVTISVYKNGVLDTSLVTLQSDGLRSGSTVVPCSGNDILDLRGDNNIALSSNARFVVKRVTGPSSVAASETVSCTVGLVTSVGVAANSPIKYDYKYDDSHNAFSAGSSGTGFFTAPISGKYRVQIVGVADTSRLWVMFKNVNGTITRDKSLMGPLANSTASGSQSIRLNAQEGVAVYLDGAATVSGGTAPALINTCTFDRTGN